MNLTRTLMVGVAASALLMSTGGCNYNDQPPCPDPNQPCKGQSHASSPGYGGGYYSGGGAVHVYGGSNSSSQGDSGHGISEAGSFGRSGGFGHGGGEGGG